MALHKQRYHFPKLFLVTLLLKSLSVILSYFLMRHIIIISKAV